MSEKVREQSGEPGSVGDAAGGSPNFEIKTLVDLYLHQSSSVNQLWTTYVVATFAGATLAITAGNAASLLLYAGVIGFSAFTVGHGLLVWGSLTLMKQAAKDIGTWLKGSRGPQALHLLAEPVWRWPSVTCHVIIDACVIGAFIYRIVTWAPPLR